MDTWETLTMSPKEVPRAGLVKAALRGQVTTRQAATALRLSVRQVQRLTRRFREGGARALLHRSRGRRLLEGVVDGLDHGLWRPLGHDQRVVDPQRDRIARLLEGRRVGKERVPRLLKDPGHPDLSRPDVGQDRSRVGHGDIHVPAEERWDLLRPLERHDREVHLRQPFQVLQIQMEDGADPWHSQPHLARARPGMVQKLLRCLPGGVTADKYGDLQGTSFITAR